MRDERGLYERLTLEGFQSGLSWLTILRKREAFRAAFRDFDPEQVARFGARDVDRLLADAGIVRHRGKIEAAIAGARATLALREAGTPLPALSGPRQRRAARRHARTRTGSPRRLRPPRSRSACAPPASGSSARRRSTPPSRRAASSTITWRRAGSAADVETERASVLTDPLI